MFSIFLSLAELIFLDQRNFDQLRDCEKQYCKSITKIVD